MLKVLLKVFRQEEMKFREKEKILRQIEEMDDDDEESDE